jgi:hypothetical protein
MEGGAASEVLTALDRTAAAGPARMVVYFAWPPLDLPAWRPRQGGLLRPMINAAKPLVRRLGGRLAGKIALSLGGRGVIDLGQRRYVLEQGSSMWLFDGQRIWMGPSLQRLVEVPRAPVPGPDFPTSPLWPLELLFGLTEAAADGSEVLGGAICHRYQGRADLGRASARHPQGLGAPSAERFEDLLAIPVTIWLDDAHVRRLRVQTEGAIHTVELFDVGTAERVPMPADASKARVR